MTRLGASLLQQLMATDPASRATDRLGGWAFRGVRRLPRQEHRHRAGADRGAPRLLPMRGVSARDRARDEDLGVAGVSLSPGLRRMTARATAAVPIAGAAELLAELAGIRLSDKRIERSAETDGVAAAERITAEATAIARRTVAVLPAPADRGDAPDKLYIAIDGTGVPMVPAATNGERRQ